MTLLANWEYGWLLIKKKKSLEKSPCFPCLSPILEGFLVWIDSYVVPYIKKRHLNIGLLNSWFGMVWRDLAKKWNHSEVWETCPVGLRFISCAGFVFEKTFRERGTRS